MIASIHIHVNLPFSDGVDALSRVQISQPAPNNCDPQHGLAFLNMLKPFIIMEWLIMFLFEFMAVYMKS